MLSRQELVCLGVDFLFSGYARRHLVRIRSGLGASASCLMFDLSLSCWLSRFDGTSAVRRLSWPISAWTHLPCAEFSAFHSITCSVCLRMAALFWTDGRNHGCRSKPVHGCRLCRWSSSRAGPMVQWHSVQFVNVIASASVPDSRHKTELRVLVSAGLWSL